MITLQEAKEKVQILFNDKMQLPEPPIAWKDRIEALDKANLPNQKSSCIFDMRKWQAETLGFQHMTSDELVMMLMGEIHTKTNDGTIRQNYEWAYNHHTDKVMEENWGGVPSIFHKIAKKGLWHMPPFAHVTLWSVQFGKLNYLKRTIPYGVVLRINECKELKLFNCFNVIAPMEAWERATDIDPIVVATQWELPPDSQKAGQVAHYFLAQW